MLIRVLPCLKQAGSTGNLAALFYYFRQEWMTNDRLPLWNVHNANFRTNNHLESWHNWLNKKVGGNKLGLFKLIHLLKDEQGEIEALINHLLSRSPAAGFVDCLHAIVLIW
ncbi:hypothetical protein T4C_2572 [Trichinella pseudospiralis]|uniref:MULE transposase domain-containing protein n=1 Tax=Trichinella pseudospiralis TaxID=6337 RepID=A0A0V1JZP2_TRIPS|nr:hypothetical protein T4C_2572 [Trichinella pseudospiralis]